MEDETRLAETGPSNARLPGDAEVVGALSIRAEWLRPAHAAMLSAMTGTSAMTGARSEAAPNRRLPNLDLELAGKYIASSDLLQDRVRTTSGAADDRHYVLKDIDGWPQVGSRDRRAMPMSRIRGKGPLDPQFRPQTDVARIATDYREGTALEGSAVAEPCELDQSADGGVGAPDIVGARQGK